MKKKSLRFSLLALSELPNGRSFELPFLSPKKLKSARDMGMFKLRASFLVKSLGEILT